jgi:hypothetical protein
MANYPSWIAKNSAHKALRHAHPVEWKRLLHSNDQALRILYPELTDHRRHGRASTAARFELAEVFREEYQELYQRELDKAWRAKLDARLAAQ